jgi:hypothetical protein
MKAAIDPTPLTGIAERLATNDEYPNQASGYDIVMRIAASALPECLDAEPAER